MKALKRINFFFITSSLAAAALLSSCKTTEQIKRERMIDELSSKVGDSEKQLTESQMQTGDLSIKVDRITEQMSRFQGAQEELKYQVDQQQLENQKENKILHERIEALEKLVQEQKVYLEQVLKGLEKVEKSFGGQSKNNKESTKGKKKELSKNLLREAVKLYERQEFQEAEVAFKEYLKEESSISPLERSKINYHLGMIEADKKQVDDALVYFSKVVTEAPDSLYAPHSLLLIGKILKDKGQKSEAKAALQQVIENYPKSKRVSEAKKILSQLKS